VITANGRPRVPDGVVLANGESRAFGDLKVESIAAYDIIPGDPSHPKGEANGYVLTIGGKRIYLAGVTECVPEVRALKNIDVAFMPMNIPLERMTPAAAAECTKALGPKFVYVYHYDQDYASRLSNARTRSEVIPNPAAVVQSLAAFRSALKGTTIEVRDGAWYPPPPAAAR